MSRDNMKGWRWISGDVSWEDYGAMWAKRSHDGAWYVLWFENMHGAGCPDLPKYYVTVYWLRLADVRMEEQLRAINSCGDTDWIKHRDPRGSWTYPEAVIEAPEEAVVATLIQYGIGGPLHSFASGKAPWKLRNDARKYAMDCMASEGMLEDALDQQANAIGNSVRDFSRGEIGVKK